MSGIEPPQDDGLCIPQVKAHSAHKHHFLRRYIDAFTTAMKNKPWSGLHYVDLFAGAGIERIEGVGLDWGSPLIAAQAKHPFSQLHLCELNRNKYDALVERTRRFPQPADPQLEHGDANELIKAIALQIPRDSLTLAFLDPYGLDLHFSTLEELSSHRSDLIIFFPDHLDALRNWKQVYSGRPDSKLDRVLNTDSWHQKMAEVPSYRWSDVLTEVYVQQIKNLGYQYFEFERIKMLTGQPLYKLIFCSASEVGADIWRRISTRKPGGQRGFDFD